MPALIPKLRFPEFRDAEGWGEKHLGSEGELISSLTGKAGADFDTGTARFVTYMNVFSNTFVDPKALRFVDVREGENQNAVACGDVFFTISSETPNDVGMSSVLLEELENCYLNSFCALFRFSESKRPNPVFTGYLLRQPLVRAYFTKKAQGSTRFNLSKDAFRSLPIYIPSTPEQQKIASCLSSLDHLITAHVQKLAALKTYKKGLMQQLFPREGETVPRLRFPQFKGEWEGTNLGNIGSFSSGGTPSKDNASYWNGTIPWISASSMYDLILKKADHYVTPLAIGNGTKIAKKGSILILVRGSMLFKRVPICVAGIDVAFNQDVKGIVVDASINNTFLLYQLSAFQSRLPINDTGIGAGKIDLDHLKGLPLFMPGPAEQERIALCLSSLNARIEAESRKLEVLKTHKKGLMQGLFPAMEAHGK